MEIFYSSRNNQTRHPTSLQPGNPFPTPQIFSVSTPTSEFLSSLSNLHPQKDENRFVINVKRSHATASDLHILPRAPTPVFFNYFVHAKKLVLLNFHNLFFSLFLIDIKDPSSRRKMEVCLFLLFSVIREKGLNRSWLLVTGMRYLVD